MPEANPWTHSVLIQPADAVVKKIEIGYRSSDGELMGFKLYAENGAIVLDVGWNWVHYGH
jgi:hypothetical protein